MKKSINRRLLAGCALVIFAAAFLAVIVIPDVIMDTSHHAWQERAVPALRALLIGHLLIAIYFMWMIAIDQRSGRMNVDLLLIIGLMLVVFSLMLIGGAFTYQDHPDLQRAASYMLLGAGLDLVAGLLTVYEWRGKKRNAQEKVA